MTTEQKKYYQDSRDHWFWRGFIPFAVIERVITTYLNNNSAFTDGTAIAFNVLIAVMGLSIIIMVVYKWVKYKGLSKWSMLFSLIGLFGFIPLALIKDRNTPIQDKI